MATDKDSASKFLNYNFECTSETKDSLSHFFEKRSAGEGCNIVVPQRSMRPNKAPEGCLFLFVEQLKYGLTLPLSDEVKDLCRAFKVIPTMLTPNACSIICGMVEFFKKVKVDWSVPTFNYFMQFCSNPHTGFVYFRSRYKTILVTEGMPSGIAAYKQNYFYVTRKDGQPWDISLKPGVTPASALKVKKNSSTVRKILDWLGGRKCVINLKKVGAPTFTFVEPEPVAEQAGKKDRDEDESSEDSPPVKRAKVAEASGSAEDEESLFSFSSEPSTPGKGLFEEGGPSKATAATPLQAREAGGPSIQWLEADCQAFVTQIPRPESYLRGGVSDIGYEVHRLVQSGPDWQRMNKMTSTELVNLACNSALNAGQLAVFLTTQWRNAGESLRDSENKNQELQSEVDRLRGLFHTAEQRQKKDEEDLAAANSKLQAAEDRVAVLEQAVDEQAGKIEALTELGASDKAQFQIISAELASTKADLAETENKLMHIRDLPAPELTPEELFERIEKTPLWAQTGLEMGEAGLIMTREYIAAKGWLTPEQMASLTYRDIIDFMNSQDV